MKELTIEQKAQRYDEAIEKTRIAYKDEDRHLKAALERIFPEIKESKAERIRRVIRGWIYTRPASFFDNGISKEEILAWLEKQGQTFTKKDVDDAYLKGIEDTKNEIEKQYEADYQIRKDIATFIFNYRGVIKDRAKWINYLGIKVSFVEKQGEQKPQGKTALEAAKEQRDLLFVKMKEARYIFDFDKKELKKIDKSKLTEFEDTVNGL